MENQAAFVSAPNAPLSVEPAALPSPSAYEVLIRNHAVAVNPIDYKQKDTGILIPEWPYILGLDTSGTIVEVGSAVTHLKKGDRVAGLAPHMVTRNKANAAFQLYTTTNGKMVSRIPDNLAFTDAVVLPLGLTTASSALFSEEYLAFDPPSASVPAPAERKNKVVLIWGASSSVGSCAVQLCAAAGYTVFTTASRKNFEYASGIGATAVFDYNDDRVVQELVEAAKGKQVVGAYDAISSQTSLANCAKFLDAAGGGRLSWSLGSAKLAEVPEKVTAVVGQPPMQGKDGGEPIWRQVWADFMGEGLQVGKLLPKPDAFVLKGGLGRLEEGLDLVRQGVSAKKIVVELVE